MTSYITLGKVPTNLARLLASCSGFKVSKESAARVSPEQRIKMLEFMLAHADFARGRVTGPDAARTKKGLQQELSLVLNSVGSGCTKSPEKWWKCWQDWKSDTKAKKIKINKYQDGTGGGPPPAPLSHTEAALLEFCGIEMVEGLPVPDPLEGSSTTLPNVVPLSPVRVEAEDSTQNAHRKQRDDPLRESLERQAAATESLAAGLNRLADNVASITAALLAIAAAIEKQP